MARFAWGVQGSRSYPFCNILIIVPAASSCGFEHNKWIKRFEHFIHPLTCESHAGQRGSSADAGLRASRWYPIRAALWARTVNNWPGRADCRRFPGGVDPGCGRCQFAPAQVPPLSDAKLKLALPNLVEEQLLADPSDCVIVAGRAADNSRLIAVVQRDWLELLVKTLHVLGANQLQVRPG